MDYRRHVIEAFTLIGAAVVCATISNAIASRDRHISFVGRYPNATVVTQSGESRSQASDSPTPDHAASTTSLQPGRSGTEPPATAMSPQSSPTPPDAATPPDGRPSAPDAAPSKDAATTARPSEAKPSAPTVGAAGLKARFPSNKDVPYLEISAEDAMWLHSHGALFLDARRTKDFERGHIPGARPFSVWEGDIDQKVEGLYNEGRDPEAPIVVYCSGGDCEDSHMLAEKLWGLFFNNVLVFKGGFPEWSGTGQPVRTGPQP